MERDQRFCFLLQENRCKTNIDYYVSNQAELERTAVDREFRLAHSEDTTMVFKYVPKLEAEFSEELSDDNSMAWLKAFAKGYAGETDRREYRNNPEKYFARKRYEAVDDWKDLDEKDQKIRLKFLKREETKAIRLSAYRYNSRLSEEMMNMTMEERLNLAKHLMKQNDGYGELRQKQFEDEALRLHILEAKINGAWD